MTDIIVVGSGISAAAACAELKKHFKVTVFEQRSHIGGNCYDYLDHGTYVHQYGCHVYHNPNAELHEWTKQFTEWRPYKHAVTAEILEDGRPKQVPFPYSKATEGALGRVLSDEDIVGAFFKGYSAKMWGGSWEDLPASIRNRVPKRQEISDFFPEQITALPLKGYTHFIENMFDGCTVIRNADPREWESYETTAQHVIYCGRLDRLRTYKGLFLGGEMVDPKLMLPGWLNHVSLRFQWGVGEPMAPTGVLNFCHERNPAIRRIQHSQITGGNSEIFHEEFPVHHPALGDLTPAYPAPRTPDTERVLAYLKMRAKQEYPRLIPLGRLASHQYIDMHAALGVGRALGRSLCPGAV